MRCSPKFSFGLSGLLLFVLSCQSPDTHHKHGDTSKYQEHVGDLLPDPQLDNPDFVPCHHDQILQYYNFGKAIQYEGEKYAIIKAFEKNYKNEVMPDQDGYVSIRFMVNCKGQSGRFRVTEMDENYNVKKLSPKITDQLLTIVKSLDGWKKGMYNEDVYDYYQYLTFKIIDGQLKKITP